MADNIKLSASSTSKQTEPEEQYVYDVENFVQKELQKAGIKPDSTNIDKFVTFTVLLNVMLTRLTNIKLNRNVIFVMSKGNMHIGGTHASDNSKMFNKKEEKTNFVSKIYFVKVKLLRNFTVYVFEIF